jgi:transaldolase
MAGTRDREDGTDSNRCANVAVRMGALELLDQISTRIFADGADLEGILAMVSDPRIAGFTTNPTLMRKAGLTDYAEFAQSVLERVTQHPISFEVFADDAHEMRRQAHIIASWGENVYVKIPITTTEGESLGSLIRELSEGGVKVNVTALFTTAQVETTAKAVADGAPSYISVFAGRIADAGVDPVPIMARSLEIILCAPRSQLIWASPREILNLIQANEIDCHIITITHDLLGKLGLLGKSLEQYSLETVRMFHNDALAAGFTL